MARNRPRRAFDGHGSGALRLYATSEVYDMVATASRKDVSARRSKASRRGGKLNLGRNAAQLAQKLRAAVRGRDHHDIRLAAAELRRWISAVLC